MYKLTKHKQYVKLLLNKSYLLFVIKELDSLPARFLKQIRSIAKPTLDKDLNKLINDVTPGYLNKIMSKAQTIDKEEEKLIISEEIKNV